MYYYGGCNGNVWIGASQFYVDDDDGKWWRQTSNKWSEILTFSNFLSETHKNQKSKKNSHSFSLPFWLTTEFHGKAKSLQKRKCCHKNARQEKKTEYTFSPHFEIQLPPSSRTPCTAYSIQEMSDIFDELFLQPFIHQTSQIHTCVYFNVHKIFGRRKIYIVGKRFNNVNFFLHRFFFCVRVYIGNEFDSFISGFIVQKQKRKYEILTFHVHFVFVSNIHYVPYDSNFTLEYRNS